MTTLSDLYLRVDHLDHKELQELRNYIDQRMEQPQLADESIQAKVKALQEAFAEMREGLTDEELDEIVEAMNAEYIEPLDPSEYDWIADEEEKAP